MQCYVSKACAQLPAQARQARAGHCCLAEPAHSCNVAETDPPTGVKKNETSTVGTPKELQIQYINIANRYVNSLRLLVLEVLVEGLEVLVEEACMVVPCDTATEKDA